MYNINNMFNKKKLSTFNSQGFLQNLYLLYVQFCSVVPLRFVQFSQCFSKNPKVRANHSLASQCFTPSQSFGAGEPDRGMNLGSATKIIEIGLSPYCRVRLRLEWYSLFP